MWSGSRQLQDAAVSLSGQCVPYRLTAALILLQTAAAPPSCATPPPTSLLPAARCPSEASLDSWMCTTCHCLPSPWRSAKHRAGAEKKKGGPKKTKQVVLLQRPNLNPPPPHPRRTLSFLLLCRRVFADAPASGGQL